MRINHNQIIEIKNLLIRDNYENNAGYGVLLLKKISVVSEELLIIKNNDVLCKYKYFSLWRFCAINIEIDILISYYLAKYSIEHSDFVVFFDWKTVIDHDNENLNNMLKQGIVDNHYHLGGSLPIFHSTWTAIMQDELLRNQICHRLCFNNRLLDRAASIRNNFLKLLSINGIKIDPNCKQQDFCLSWYYEERKFMFSVIRECLKNNTMFCSAENMLYEYLTIKEKYRELFVLHNHHVDVSDFFSVINNRNIVLNSCGNIDGIIKSGISECLRSDYIDKMEIRISMKDPSSLYHCINVINSHINAQYPCVKNNYIISFSRRIVENNDVLYRNKSKRDLLRDELKKLFCFMNEYPLIAMQIIGIDVSSREDHYNPEVFSELMHDCMVTREKALKRMYHVGEVFSDFLTGLRRIDECLTYFELQKNDRLAHAVPVYADIRQWYCNHDYKVKITKEEYLDNITWLFCCLPKNVQLMQNAKAIMDEFSLVFKELYFDAFCDKQYQSLIQSNDIVSMYEEISITHCYEAWKLRNKKPEDIEKSLQARNLNSDEVISYFIAYLYFYRIDVQEKGKQMIEISASPEYISFVETVQEVVQTKIVNQGVCIEVCPSSSSFLSDVSMGDIHPVFKLYEKNKKKSIVKDMCISFNTDDMDIFSTSLINEYSLVASVYEMNSIHTNGSNNTNTKNFYKWLNDIRLNSNRMFSSDSYM